MPILVPAPGRVTQQLSCVPLFLPTLTRPLCAPDQVTQQLNRVPFLSTHPPLLLLPTPPSLPPPSSCPPPPSGHYVSLIKSHSSWLFFDDETVDGITESQIQSTFGSTQEYGSSNMDHG